MGIIRAINYFVDIDVMGKKFSFRGIIMYTLSCAFSFYIVILISYVIYLKIYNSILYISILILKKRNTGIKIVSSRKKKKKKTPKKKILHSKKKKKKKKKKS